MRPPASTIAVSSERDRSISARGPTAAMRPPRMRRAPSAMMARERMAAPERAPGGPARVTSWRQWTIARSVMGQALQPCGADPRSAADALAGWLRLGEAVSRCDNWRRGGPSPAARAAPGAVLVGWGELLWGGGGPPGGGPGRTRGSAPPWLAAL